MRTPAAANGICAAVHIAQPNDSLKYQLRYTQTENIAKQDFAYHIFEQHYVAGYIRHWPFLAGGIRLGWWQRSYADAEGTETHNANCCIQFSFFFHIHYEWYRRIRSEIKNKQGVKCCRYYNCFVLFLYFCISFTIEQVDHGSNVDVINFWRKVRFVSFCSIRTSYSVSSK